MGYYTKYTFRCFDNREEEIDYSIPSINEKLVKALHKINPNYFDADLYLPHFFYEDMKWYDHHEDMIELSKQFPEYVFLLEGDGEDSDDYWRAVYKEGMSDFMNSSRVFERPETDFGKIVYRYYGDMER